MAFSPVLQDTKLIDIPVAKITVFTMHSEQLLKVLSSNIFHSDVTLKFISVIS